MIRHPDSNLQIAEKIELALSSQNKRVNTEGTNIVTNEFNREDYVINKAQTEISLQSLAQGKQDVLTAGDGININDNNVISVGKVPNAITFSNDGDGAASGSTFDGSAARKLSYNSIGVAPIGFFMLTASDDYSATKTLTHISGVSKLNTGGMYLFYIPTTNKHNNAVDYSASFSYGGKKYKLRLDPNRQPIADRYAAWECWGHGIYIAVINGTNVDLLKLSMGEKLVNFSLRSSNNSSWGAFDDKALEDGKGYIVYCDGFTFGSGEIYFSSTAGNYQSRIYLDGSLVTNGTTIPKGYYKCKNSLGSTYCQLYTLAI